MAFIEFKADYDDDNPLSLEIKVGEIIDKHCQKLGLLLRPAFNMCILSPPLILNKNDIETIVKILREGITLAMEELQSKGLWNNWLFFSKIMTKAKLINYTIQDFLSEINFN